MSEIYHRVNYEVNALYYVGSVTQMSNFFKRPISSGQTEPFPLFPREINRLVNSVLVN